MKRSSCLLIIVAWYLVGCGARGEPRDLRDGLTALKNKDYERGVECLSKVVELHGGTVWAAEALYFMGYAYEHGQSVLDLEKAQEYYRQYLQTFPTYQYRQQAEKGLADCLYWRGQFEEASQAYQQYAKDNPGEDWVLFRLAMCRFNLGQYEQCRDLAEESIKARPQSIFVPHLLYLIASCYEREAKPAVAQETYNRLIDSYPVHHLSWSAKQDLDRLAEGIVPAATPTPTAGEKSKGKVKAR